VGKFGRRVLGTNRSPETTAKRMGKYSGCLGISQARVTTINISVPHDGGRTKTFCSVIDLETRYISAEWQSFFGAK